MTATPWRRAPLALACAAALFAGAGAVHASSHREAPFITQQPKVDGTDFYMFRSYEAGRSDYVTLVANYIPLQDAYGGPNYFAMDPEALYEIHVDNNGDAVEDISFQFRFKMIRAPEESPADWQSYWASLTFERIFDVKR